MAVINDLSLLHPNEKQIPIHPTEDLPDIPKNKIDLILKRLENIIKYVQPPLTSAMQVDKPDRWFQCFILEVNEPKFDKYLRLIGLDPSGKTPPEGWSLEELANKAVISRYETTLYTFKSVQSRKYLAFKRLWKSYNTFVGYPELQKAILLVQNQKKISQT